ncbi:MAG: transporter substrate-binding domain-containing protein [Burkholderiaceae bacterium]|nr:transporter substrate-binding domain-containing protein [Burkholderiaceae bacterium]
MKNTDTGFSLSRRQMAQAAAVSALGLALPAAAIAQTATPAGEAESTMARVRRTKKLRIAALVGEPPYFSKDPLTGIWKGAAVEMAKDIASILDVELEMVDSTYGNSVIQLQTGKVDLAMALTPTPLRALSIDFSHPTYLHPYGLVSNKDIDVSTWEDLNKSDLKIAVDLGSTQEMLARRLAPNAKITAYATRDDVMMALQSKRVDCAVFAVLLGLTAVKKSPAIGKFSMLKEPVIGLTSSLAFAKESNTDWRNFLDVWVDHNRSLGQIQEWIFDGLLLSDVQRSDIPADVVF